MKKLIQKAYDVFSLRLSSSTISLSPVYNLPTMWTNDSIFTNKPPSATVMSHTYDMDGSKLSKKTYHLTIIPVILKVRGMLSIISEAGILVTIPNIVSIKNENWWYLNACWNQFDKWRFWCQQKIGGTWNRLQQCFLWIIMPYLVLRIQPMVQTDQMVSLE